MTFTPEDVTSTQIINSQISEHGADEKLESGATDPTGSVAPKKRETSKTKSDLRLTYVIKYQRKVAIST